MPILSDEQFRSILDAIDGAVVSIRGHVAIESALSEVISRALPDPHQLEIDRISFMLKVDLAIALKALPKESRPLFLKLNTVRNRFAHQATAELDDQSAVELRNSMSVCHRKMVGDHFENATTPRDSLRVATAAAFYESRAASESLRKRSVEREVWQDEVKALLESTKHLEGHPAGGQFSQRVKKRVQERLIQGDSK